MPPQKPVTTNGPIISRENQNLLTLAVKCRLITVVQEKQVLAGLIEKLDLDPDYSVVRFFKEENFLTDEDLDFLFAVKDHLQLKMQDRRFGELSIANKFVNPQNVKKAIDLQSEIFKETRQSKMIGDILLEKKEISKADKAAILLTQDRVEDEFLAEAINDIAATEMEKISINMRFGAIAVKKGMITIEQLNQALQVQTDERKSDQPLDRNLGAILKDLFSISDQEITQILKIQKEFEKQRLSLEKALSQYNLETAANKRLTQIFEYRFSKNKLQAFTRISKEILEEISVSAFQSWIESIGIRFGICDEKTIETFLAAQKVGSEIQVAQGQAPKSPVNESIEYLFDTKNSEQTASGTPVLVKKGAVLAKIKPHQEGSPGKNVNGFPISPPLYSNISLGAGEGVEKKGLTFVAETDGTPTLYKNRTLFVTQNEVSYPTKYHTGHVKSDLGEEYEFANLIVDGNIEKDGRVVSHNLTVKGDVQGEIRATGEVRINGNITRDEKRSPPFISAQKDIVVNKNIKGAVIITSQLFKAPNSDLISSNVTAFHDIFLKNIYSKDEIPSILQIGKNPNLKADAVNPSIDEQKKVLGKLLHEEELSKIQKWFDGKIQTQNDYLEQLNILKQLCRLMDDTTLNNDKTLEQKFIGFKSNPEEFNDLNSPDALFAPANKKFMQQVFKETRDLAPSKQKKSLEEMKSIKSGMYRAAVNATQRHKNAYKAKKEFIRKKVKKRSPQIRETKQKLENLYNKKDFIKLKEDKRVPSVKAAVRVKNQIEKGSVIKGKTSGLIVDQTIYSVRFSEGLIKGSKKQSIIIEGLYD